MKNRLIHKTKGRFVSHFVTTLRFESKEKLIGLQRSDYGQGERFRLVVIDKGRLTVRQCYFGNLVEAREAYEEALRKALHLSSMSV